MNLGAFLAEAASNGTYDVHISATGEVQARRQTFFRKCGTVSLSDVDAFLAGILIDEERQLLLAGGMTRSIQQIGGKDSRVNVILEDGRPTVTIRIFGGRNAQAGLV